MLSVEYVNRLEAEPIVKAAVRLASYWEDDLGCISLLATSRGTNAARAGLI